MTAKLVVKNRFFYNDILYLLIGTLIFLSVLQSSLLQYAYRGFFQLSGVLANLLRVLIGLWCILMIERFSKKELIKYITLGCCMVMSYLAIGSFMLFDLFFVALLMKERISYHRMINVFFYATLIATSMVFLMNLCNVFPEYQVFRYETKVERYSCGFTHPNICGRMILNIWCLYLLKKGMNIKWYMILAIVFSACWVYTYPGSVTPTILLIMIACSLVAVRVYRFFCKRELAENPLFRIICLAAAPAIFAAVIWIMFHESQGAFLNNLSQTFYSRFTGGFEAYQKYPVKLFGNILTFTGTAQNYFTEDSSTYFIIDCLYILLPLQYGSVVTAYFLYQSVKAIKVNLEKKNTCLLIVFLIYLIYSLSESGMIVIYTAFVFICTYADREIPEKNSGCIKVRRYENSEN